MVRNMTSNETDVWGHILTNLIYRHLKKNGHKEAASALRKHAPKVATKHVKVSLNDIFRQWMSEKQEKKNAEKCTDKNQITSNSKNSVSKSKTANIVAAGRKKDKKRKQNEESKKNLKLTLAEGQTSVNLSMQDDSDSSLDVDKWKKLALELSDTDVAKMDALTNFSTSSVASSDNSTKVQKSAKTDLNIHKGKSKLLNKKTEHKTVPCPSLTEKNITPSKIKVKRNKSLTSSNFESQSKNTKDRTTCSDSTELHSEDESTLSEANNDGVISLLPSDQSKTSNIGNSEPTETPSKKSKFKKDAKRQELQVVGMFSQRADNEVSHDQLTYDQANTSGHILGDKHTKTPSKNAKSKKSKPVDEATLSGEGGINEVSSYSKPYQTETRSKQPTNLETKIAVAFLAETPSGKVKKSFIGLNDTETPSKKKESHIDVSTRVDSEPPSPSNVSDAVVSEEPHKKSKKSKRKRFDNSENMPSSVTESEWDHSQVDNGLILCDTSTQDQHEKFRKGGEDKNRSASAMEEGSPEPKKRKKSKKDKKSQIETDELVVQEEPLTQPLEDLFDSLPCSQKKKKKKKNHKDVELQTMSTPSPKEQTPKKKKKSSKERTCTDDEAE